MAAEGTGKPTIIYNKKIKKLYKIEVEKLFRRISERAVLLSF